MSLLPFSHLDNIELIIPKRPTLNSDSIRINHRKIESCFNLRNRYSVVIKGRDTYINQWGYFNSSSKVSYSFMGNYIKISLAKQLIGINEMSLYEQLIKSFRWLIEQGFIFKVDNIEGMLCDRSRVTYEHAITFETRITKPYNQNGKGKIYCRRKLFQGTPITRLEVKWRGRFHKEIETTQGIVEAYKEKLIKKHTNNLFDKFKLSEIEKVFSIRMGLSEHHNRRKVRALIETWVMERNLLRLCNESELNRLQGLEYQNMI